MERASVRRSAGAVTTDRPTTRLIVYVCLVGMMLGMVYLSDRLLTASGVQEAARLSSSPGGAEALAKARHLCERLAPGESLPLVLLRQDAPDPAASGAGEKAQRPPHDRHDGHGLWVVQSADASPTAAFLATFDGRTGTLQRLSWAAPAAARRRPVEGAEGADAGRDLLDAARAVAETRRVLRRLGVPGAGGPWRVVSVQQRRDPSYARAGWRVGLSSPRWSVWSFLDPASADLLVISFVPQTEQRRRAPSSSPSPSLWQEGPH
jgi:hypothetical protein